MGFMPFSGRSFHNMQAHRFIVLFALMLSACGESPTPLKGEQGPPGPEGPAGPVGPAGSSGAVIRFVDSECRGACTVACEPNERILNTYAINPGGVFILENDNRATFRPQRPGVSIKVSVACIQK